MSDLKVDQIQKGAKDSAGVEILTVYAKDSGNYAVYRTTERVAIEFADAPMAARDQRARMASLNPLRGEINALVDGWRRSRNEELRRKAEYFDRRVADSLIVALEGDVPSAISALEAVKRDLVEDRTSWARFLYLCVGASTACALIVLIGFATSDWFATHVARQPADTAALWIAAAGGAVGAFFSIAIAIRGRTVLPDLQMRDNIADSLLRIVIGVIAATLLICLLISHAVRLRLGGADLAPETGPYSWMLALIVGFTAGFSERLVPDLLARSALVAGPPAPPVNPTPPPLVATSKTAGDTTDAGAAGGSGPAPSTDRVVAADSALAPDQPLAQAASPLPSQGASSKIKLAASAPLFGAAKGRPMAKLVVCLDGTNQTWAQTHPTNIALIFNALGGAPVDAGNGSFETAIAGGFGQGKYLPGVGTQGNPILKLLGAAFGDGIAEPIIRGYTFLSRSYSPGDEIFIVGFSRGATAARALAGLVVAQGLLDLARYDPADKNAAYLRGIAAWYKYREGKPNFAQQARLQIISGTLGQNVPALSKADFVAPPNIQAVGVFDTVSSLGLPHLDSDGDAKFDFSICDTQLNDKVLNGVHALSADEWRDLFSPTYWSDRPGVIQHIFPGTHSNVGGGYPERGLSDGALAWMLEQMEALGLPTNRAALGLKPDPLDVARDDGAIFPDNQTPRRPRAFPACAKVDPFLIERVGQSTDMIPDPKPAPYRPRGVFADGAPLVS
jgi:uncharacterized protein (DUF2235 family)